MKLLFAVIAGVLLAGTTVTGASGVTCARSEGAFDWTIAELSYMNREELVAQYCFYHGNRDIILRDTIMAADNLDQIMACDRVMGNILRVLRKDHNVTTPIPCEGFNPKKPEPPSPE